MRPGVYEADSALPPHPHVPPSAAVGWKSPVPYLFGGLAAMLGLIAFALLILACSYWKLSGHLDGGDEESAGAGEGKGKDDGVKESTEGSLMNSILVIMAGDAKPTFLAMPAEKERERGGDSRASCSCGGSGSGSGGDGSGDERREKVVEMVEEEEKR